MYRISIDGSDWIILFSTHLQIKEEDKGGIVHSLKYLVPKLPRFSHGESFLLYDEKLGVIVFRTEKVPSLILTVSMIVPKDKWFLKKVSGIDRYKKQK